MATSSMATRCPPTRLRFNPRRRDPLSSVREHDDIAGLDVRRGVLTEAEVVAGCVVEAVDRHRGFSIDRVASLPGSHERTKPASALALQARAGSARTAQPRNGSEHQQAFRWYEEAAFRVWVRASQVSLVTNARRA
jgi:hypothetical protein